MQLGGELKIGVYGVGALRPQLGKFGFDVAVEGGVDLDHVEALGEEIQGMLFVARHASGIENALPVFVRPTGGAHPHLAEAWHSHSRLQVSTAKVAQRQAFTESGSTIVTLITSGSEPGYSAMFTVHSKVESALGLSIS